MWYCVDDHRWADFGAKDYSNQEYAAFSYSFNFYSKIIEYGCETEAFTVDDHRSYDFSFSHPFCHDRAGYVYELIY